MYTGTRSRASSAEREHSEWATAGAFATRSEMRRVDVHRGCDLGPLREQCGETVRIADDLRTGDDRSVEGQHDRRDR